MSPVPPVPLFIGPVELMLVGAVVLVIIFGSRATDIAREAGSAAGKVKQTRREAEKEIEEVKGEFEEGIEPIKEEAQAVEEEVKDVEEDIKDVEEDLGAAETDLTASSDDGPERNVPLDDEQDGPL